MSDLTIAICDDLKEAQVTLHRMLQQYFRRKGLNARMRPFASGEELLSAGRERVDIPLSSIQYIEVIDHQAYIHTEKEVIVTRRKLEDLMNEIDSEDFLRCHRSYLVNMNHIQGFQGTEFHLTGGDRIPISTVNPAKIRGQFIDWTYKKAWSRR